MKNSQGFTIIEVLVAVMVLSVGVLALVGSSALVTRMIGGGKHATRSVQLAEQRLELLRQRAHSTDPACTALANGTTTQAGAYGTTEQWTVAATPGIPGLRDLSVSVTYPASGGPRTISLFTTIRCG